MKLLQRRSKKQKKQYKRQENSPFAALSVLKAQKNADPSDFS